MRLVKFIRIQDKIINVNHVAAFWVENEKLFIKYSSGTEDVLPFQMNGLAKTSLNAITDHLMAEQVYEN